MCIYLVSSVYISSILSTIRYTMRPFSPVLTLLTICGCVSGEPCMRACRHSAACSMQHCSTAASCSNGALFRLSWEVFPRLLVLSRVLLMEGWSGGAARDHHLIARPNEYTAGAAHTAGVWCNCDITHIDINNIQGQCILARFPYWKHQLALSHFNRHS